jgi:hypothetical protein
LIGLFIFLGAIQDGKIASHEAGTLILGEFAHASYLPVSSNRIIICKLKRGRAVSVPRLLLDISESIDGFVTEYQPNN